MRFILPSGIHLITASLTGRQMPANTKKATNGFAKTASTHSISSSKSRPKRRLS